MNHKNLMRLILLVVIAALSSAAGMEAPGNKPTCDICENYVRKAKDLVNNPRTVDQIHQKLDQICNFLQFVGQDQACKEQVNKYIDQAIDYIQHSDPLVFCQKIRFCTPEQVASKRAEQEVAISSIRGFSDTPDRECTDCIAAMGKLSDYVQDHNNPTNDELLKNVCLNLETVPRETACGEIVTVVGDKIVEMIRKMKSPQDFCENVSLMCW